MTFGGDGQNPSNPVTTYMFPNDTDPSFPAQTWNEITANNPPADRRFVMGAGKFTFQPGAVQCINFAVVWARTQDTSASGLISVPELQAASDHVQSYFDNLCDSVLFSSIDYTDVDFGINVYPVPADDFVSIEFDNEVSEMFILELFNLTGKKIQEVSGIKDSKVNLITSELSKGAYLYKLTKLTSGKFNTGKLIIN